MEFYTIDEVLGPPRQPDPRNPVTVEAGSRFERALELMVENDFSQIPVMDDGAVAGVVTHESVYRALSVLDDHEIGEVSSGTVAEKPGAFVSWEDDVYSLFERFAEDSYVLVGSPKDLEGIVTYYDVFHFIKSQIKPFLLIGDIERELRTTFEEVYGDGLDDRIRETFEPIEDVITPDGVEMFSFEQYRAFISINWDDDLEHEFSEDKQFILNRLKDVQEIRNAIFHFRDAGDDHADDKLELAHDCFTDTNW